VAPRAEAPPDDDRRAGRGPGRILVAVYAVFAIAATGRATLQIVEYFHRAPVAYTLSALAALIYIVATVALARGDRTSVRVATVSCSIELAGVLVVGVLSYVDTEAFPDKTVWSHFGSGYGYIPLVLPVIGLLWLRSVCRRRAPSS
jgi:hypothetical protein